MTLCNFLLRLKRVEMSLNDCWRRSHGLGHGWGLHLLARSLTTEEGMASFTDSNNH